MERALSAVFLVAVWGWLEFWQGAAQSPPIFEIHEPTIIAFFPITKAEVDSGEGGGEALGDFTTTLQGSNQRLHPGAGVAIHVVNAHSFQIRAERKRSLISPRKTRSDTISSAPVRSRISNMMS